MATEAPLDLSLGPWISGFLSGNSDPELLTFGSQDSWLSIWYPNHIDTGVGDPELDGEYVTDDVWYFAVVWHNNTAWTILLTSQNLWNSLRYYSEPSQTWFWTPIYLSFTLNA